MIRRPPRSTHCISSAASDVYKRQALQAPVIMMSQNRQEEKDRERAKKDYMVNLKSELEIRMLHEKIDHLIINEQQEILDIHKAQVDMLNDILKRIEKLQYLILSSINKNLQNIKNIKKKQSNHKGIHEFSKFLKKRPINQEYKTRYILFETFPKDKKSKKVCFYLPSQKKAIDLHLINSAVKHKCYYERERRYKY
eukprot:TRINITY_DN6889_c0_g1_i1.p1 TRINITY_DN6889_c0_g1~~TRINITY_DN6889_c0_g1_i1.p1  ORF type:complete len:196 (-),score=45.15 TRINITY_DN6889_c0_g1_i1:182-769(-)